MTTTLTAPIDTDARAWIGCLSCYNSGRLIGEWYPAREAGDISTDALHIDAGTVARVSCEELWVMDHEGLPISGECSPTEAQAWGDLLDEVDEWQRAAFLAWVREGNYSHGSDGLPTVSEFEDAYAGEFASFREFAENLADDTGMLSEVPDEIAAYFNWSAWTRDLAYDYTTADAPGAGVFVFSNH